MRRVGKCCDLALPAPERWVPARRQQGRLMFETSVFVILCVSVVCVLVVVVYVARMLRGFWFLCVRSRSAEIRSTLCRGGVAPNPPLGGSPGFYRES